MKKITTLLFAIMFFSFSNAQTTISRTLIRSFTKAQLDSTLNANSIPAAIVGTVYGVDVYKLIYNTVTFDSSATIASGLLCVPKNISCKLSIASYQHGTVTKKDDAPSRFNSVEGLLAAILASTGYVAMEPDYLGLGDGPGIHFYQHAKTEGTAVIDMIRAGRETCDSVGVKLNGQVFLTGYSEGGHATMAAHKLIQEKVDNEMHVTASIPMSGAYDMSGVMVNVMLSDSVYPSPSYLAYLVASWNVAYQLYDSLDAPLVYPYDSLIYQWFDGTHSTGYIDNRMPGVPKHIFKPDTIAAFTNDTNHTFRLRLKDNDVDNWVPTSPVKMLFCSSDTYVSDSNTFVAIQKMRALGCLQCDSHNVNSTMDHQACAQIAILMAKNYADSLRIIDCSSGIDDIRMRQFSIFPNPATSEIQIDIPSTLVDVKSIEIISAEGKLVRVEKNLRIINNISLPVSNFASGIYFVRITSNEGDVMQSRFVKE